MIQRALLLVALSVALYWPIFWILPFDWDNLYVLRWAEQTPVGATGVGSVIRGVFDSEGLLGISGRRIALSVPGLVAAGLAWRYSPTHGRLMALVIGFTALLNAPLYRERNQVAALAAFSVMAGLGRETATQGGTRLSKRIRTSLLAGVCASLLVLQGLRTHREISDFAFGTPQMNLCSDSISDAEREFGERVNLRFGGMVSWCAESERAESIGESTLHSPKRFSSLEDLWFHSP